MPFSPRRYTLFFKFSVEKAVLWDERIATVLNLIDEKMSRTKAWSYIFERGLEAIEAEAKENGTRIESSDVELELRRLERERAKTQRLGKLYELKGFDDFVDWCEEKEIDWETFLMEYQVELERVGNWTDIARLWLGNYFHNGDCHHTDKIRKDAISDGIIETDKDWNKLKVLAHREGYTKGKKFYWQKHPFCEIDHNYKIT